jgi:hypothetical protein
MKKYLNYKTGVIVVIVALALAGGAYGLTKYVQYEVKKQTVQYFQDHKAELKGDKGDRGFKGDTGDKGAAGANGVNGANGKNGAQGAAGQSGSDGCTWLGWGYYGEDLGFYCG